MKYILASLCFSIFSLVINSQSIDYVGYIELENKTYINYKLELDAIDGKITGYSFTDLNGAHETKTSIIGTYDKTNDHLKFREVDIVYTKSPVEEFDFCHIYFDGKLNKNRLVGEFKSYYDDLESCLKGKLIMSKTEKIVKRQQKVANKVERVMRRREMEDTISSKLADLNFTKKNTLSSGENLNVFWDTGYLKLAIWDAGTVDNDKIKIVLNDSVVKEIVPKKRFSYVEYFLKEPKNTIKIAALSEGLEPPNTAMIKMYNSKGETIDLVSNLKLGETATITVYKARPKKDQ